MTKKKNEEKKYIIHTHTYTQRDGRKEECDLRKMCCTYKYAHYLIKGQNVEQIVLST